LKATAVDRAMAELPAWRLGADRRSIRGAFRFPAVPPAMVFILWVAGGAEPLGIAAEVRLSGTRVGVRLAVPRSGGLTAEVFRLARLLESEAAACRGRWPPSGWAAGEPR
jgi:pterin-4a-carbinolamine dehydratase